MTAVVMNAAGPITQNTVTPGNALEQTAEKGDFASLMRERLGKSSDSQTNAVRDEASLKSPVQKQNTVSEVSDEGSSRARVKKATDHQSSEKSVSMKTEGYADDDKMDVEEAAEAISVLNGIFTGITEILGISPEELNDAMNAMGMTPADLTDKNGLAQLVLFLNGSDNMADMLVDNGMLEAFNELTGFVEGRLNEKDLPQEYFAQLLNRAGSEELLSSETVRDAVGKLPEALGKFFDAAAENEQADGEIATEQDLGTLQETVITVEKREGAGQEGQNGEMSEDTDAADMKTTSQENGADGTERLQVSSEAFANRLNSVYEEKGVEEAGQTDFGEIMRQIVEQVKVNISPERTSLEMKLNPDNLGRVSINIVSKNGVMTAEIHTENQTAREAIESQLQILKENIEQKGIRVEEIEVKISDFHFADSKNAEGNGEANGNQGNGKQHRSGFAGLSEGEADTESMMTAREIMESAETTVNYRV